MKAKYILSSVIVISILIIQITFAAPPRYEIIDLGTLGGDMSRANSINSSGQIVGYAYNRSDGRRATLFDPTGNGNNLDLGTLGGDSSSASAINDAGRIVGTADINSAEHHATWFDPTGNGTSIALGTLGGKWSYALSINDKGQIVGTAYIDFSYFSATLFDPTGNENNINLGTLGGDYSVARSINTNGQIVGEAKIGAGYDHATLFDASGGGNNMDLGTLGGTTSVAYSINDAGQIVGWAFNASSERFATLFDPNGNGNNIALGSLGYAWSRAKSINNKGQIVGSAYRKPGPGNELATLFDPTGNGNNIDLNTLIDPACGLTLTYAYSINDHGWIVGQGLNPKGEEHAYLLKPIPPKIIYVDDDATGANDGSSWDDAFNFLQDALAAAWSGDEIRVAQGIYKPDRGASITPGDREATFQLINGVTIKGGYAGLGQPDPNARDIQLYKTILTGAGNSYHVVTGSRTDETAVLDGFTVTGGNANAKWPEKDDSGSGMFNHNGSPRLANCTFKGNKAYYGAGIYNISSIRPPMLTNCIISDNWAYNYGGGIYNKNCSPILTNCTFSDNKARDGAGMYNMSNRSMLSNCAFINNWASEGGGMYNRHDGNPTLTNCTFSGNSANFYGGGMANRHSSPTMTNCIFSENSADAGGGIRNLDSNPTLTNCIFSGNSAYEGGGMFCAFSSPTLINCTLSGNSASDYGGGIYGEHSSNPTLTNCTLWGNSDSEIESSAVITYSDIKGGWPGIGNIDTDPLFIDPGYWDANGVWTDGDYRLLPDSPCIDAGDPNYMAGPDETDLDGNPRVMGGRIDMGAYEYSPTIPAETRILPRTINLASKGRWITTYIWLPDGYNVADIDPNSILLEDEIQPDEFSVDERQQVATAMFDRKDVQGILDISDVELTITGQLTDGTIFEAKDIIKVIDKAGDKSFQ